MGERVRIMNHTVMRELFPEIFRTHKVREIILYVLAVLIGIIAVFLLTLAIGGVIWGRIGSD